MRVFLDTSPLIYLIEGNLEYREKVAAQLGAWVKNNAIIGTSALTLLELLVIPKKKSNDHLAHKYRAMVSELLSEPMIPISEAIAEKAAEFRARKKFKTPDAIQLACAIHSGFDVFYTNDRQLKQCKEIDIVLVEE